MDGITSSAEAARFADVLQAGQKAVSDLLGHTDDPLQCSPEGIIRDLHTEESHRVDPFHTDAADVELERVCFAPS